jgi:hypothetical protein
MKTRPILAFIILCLGIVLSGLYGPWYAPAAFVALGCALMTLSMKHAIWLGLASSLLIYAAMALILLNRDDAEIISKTGNLLGGLAPFMVVMVTAVIGGVTGLLAGWTGSAIGQLLRNTTTSTNG